jgi:hypothetical protein
VCEQDRNLAIRFEKIQERFDPTGNSDTPKRLGNVDMPNWGLK